MADNITLIYSQQRSKMTPPMDDERLQKYLQIKMPGTIVSVSSKKGGFLAFNSSIEYVTVTLSDPRVKNIRILISAFDSTLSKYGFPQSPQSAQYYS